MLCGIIILCLIVDEKEQMEESLNDARDTIEAKKTQIMMLQKELGKI